MRIAIAFGGGKESLQLVEMLSDKNPLLITCFDSEDERKYKDRLQEMADSANLKIIFIRGDGFKENWEWDTGTDEIKYDNTILKHYRNNGEEKPFDILYVGRRAKDILKRCGVPLKDLPKQLNIEGVRFPLWLK